jgi:hypothetical protein
MKERVQRRRGVRRKDESEEGTRRTKSLFRMTNNFLPLL